MLVTLKTCMVKTRDHFFYDRYSFHFEEGCLNMSRTIELQFLQNCLYQTRPILNPSACCRVKTSKSIPCSTSHPCLGPDKGVSLPLIELHLNQSCPYKSSNHRPYIGLPSRARFIKRQVALSSA